MILLPLLLAPPVTYVPYANARFGFAVERPSFLLPQAPPENGDGREFRAGGIVMRVYASLNVDGSTPTSALRAAIPKGVKPDLAVIKAGWYALSYVDKRVVHYEKTFVSRTKHTTVEFEYPTAQGARMGPVVTHVVRSFRP